MVNYSIHSALLKSKFCHDREISLYLITSFDSEKIVYHLLFELNTHYR